MIGWDENRDLSPQISTGQMFKFLKKIFAEILHSNRFISNYYYTTLRIIILNTVKTDKLGVFKIKNFQQKSPAEKILKGYTYKSTTQNNLIVTVPDLNLYFFEDALISPRSSAIVCGSNIYYEAISSNERFNGVFVKHHDVNNAIVRLGEKEIISEGFFLAGNGSCNWYHWIIEILPKMLFYKKEYSPKILVEESCKNIQSMAESLQFFSKKFDVEVIFMKTEKTYLVKNLYFVNEVNKLMYNAIDNDLHNPPLYYYRQESLKKLRESFLKNRTNQKLESEKIYLERKNTHRIAKNEDSLLKTLHNQGVNNVDLVGLNIIEQINVFNNASVVIGITGAAWTNILFCEPNTKCIIFMPNNYKTYQFYGELAEMLQVEVKYLYYENGSDNHEKSDFVINLNELENLLVTSYE